MSTTEDRNSALVSGLEDRLIASEIVDDPYPMRVIAGSVIGFPVARLELRVVLAKLLERTERFELDPDRPAHWVDSLWVRRHERVPLVAFAAGVRRSRA